MSKIEIRRPEQLDELELLQVQSYMSEKYPELYGYTIAPGNECVWVYWGSTYPMNLYFLFNSGQISTVMMD